LIAPGLRSIDVRQLLASSRVQRDNAALPTDEQDVENARCLADAGLPL